MPPLRLPLIGRRPVSCERWCRRPAGRRVFPRRPDGATWRTIRVEGRARPSSRPPGFLVAVLLELRHLCLSCTMCLMSEAERMILLVPKEPPPAKRSAFSLTEIGVQAASSRAASRPRAISLYGIRTHYSIMHSHYLIFHILIFQKKI